MKIANSLFLITSPYVHAGDNDSCERYFETLLVACVNQCTASDPNCLSLCNRLHEQNLAKCPGQAQCHGGFERSLIAWHSLSVIRACLSNPSDKFKWLSVSAIRLSVGSVQIQVNVSLEHVGL